MPSMSPEMKILRGRGCACATEADSTRATATRPNMTRILTDARPADVARTPGRANLRAVCLSLRPVCVVTLAGKQRFLPLRSPPIPAFAACGRHHAMTWHGERHRVGRAGAGDGADRARPSDCGRGFRVCARLAVRDRRQRLPHLPLKCRRL